MFPILSSALGTSCIPSFQGITDFNILNFSYADVESCRIASEPKATRTNEGMRNALVDMGQAPHTAIIGCADSRAPLETIFDAMPGDIFALRNAGNTCTHAEGSMVGSLEFSTGKLGCQLILVLGHTKCGAVYGATNAYLEAKKSTVTSVNSALEGLLLDLAPVAEQALAEMGPNSDLDVLAEVFCCNAMLPALMLKNVSSSQRLIEIHRA